MPLFPVIDCESLVQEEDKTRIDVSKSYASGAAAITGMTVSPSAGVAPIDVFDNGYLDWQYPFALDVVTGENDRIDFREGQTNISATLAAGEYTLAALCVEIAAKMTAAGGLTYTATVSAQNRITISANGVFSLLLGSDTALNPLPAMGFGVADLSASATYTGAKVERITKRIELAVNNGEDEEADSATATAYIEVISALADNLFSSDDRLRKHEADIMKDVPQGRASFKDVHRRAQTLILAWLDTEGFSDYLGEPLTLSHLTEKEDFREWATMMALRLINENVSNAVDDVFSLKARKYGGLEEFYRNRATVRVDLNNDGVADNLTERLDIRSCRVVRR